MIGRAALRVSFNPDIRAPGTGTGRTSLESLAEPEEDTNDIGNDHHAADVCSSARVAGLVR